MKFSEFNLLAQQTSFENALKKIENTSDSDTHTLPPVLNDVVHIIFVLSIFSIVGPPIIDVMTDTFGDLFHAHVHAAESINAYLHK